MSDPITTFWRDEYEPLVEHALDRAPVLASLRRGELPAGDPIRLLVRHYAEVRTALDFKLPNRLRLCPRQAVVAKRFFWRLYAEEQGEFDAGSDHASLFAVLCRQLGVSDDDMEAEFKSYWPHYAYMLTEQPSHEILVRELTISTVWESVILRLGGTYLALIAKTFDVRPEALTYFLVHQDADAHHSKAALEVLKHYAVTEEALAIVRAAIEQTLVSANPWALGARDA